MPRSNVDNMPVRKSTKKRVAGNVPTATGAVVIVDVFETDKSFAGQIYWGLIRPKLQVIEWN